MLDVSVDDRFLLMTVDNPGEFGVTHFQDGYITLRRYPRGEQETIEFTRFAVEHADGNIVRTARRGQSLSVLSAKHLLSLFKPEGRDVTVGELEDWEEVHEAVTAAATKQFYANQYLLQRKKNLDYTKTEEDLTDFINTRHDDAKKRGLGKWIPSASTIRKLVFGRTEQVSLADCLYKTGTVRNKHIWPTWVYDLADDAIGKIQSGSMPNVGEAYKWLFGEFYLGKEQGEGIPKEQRPTPPTLRCFRNWFNEATNRESAYKLFGPREANKEWKGTISPQDAIAPLQIVIIDQTQGNIWSAVKSRHHTGAELPAEDENGLTSNPKAEEVLSSKRVEVVYAVDVCSRKSLALILTFEPPSIDTFMACLKMVMTPKVSGKKGFQIFPTRHVDGASR